jgi:hypothetical protein
MNSPATIDQINKINNILKNPNFSTDSIFNTQNITANGDIKLNLHLTEQSDKVLLKNRNIIFAILGQTINQININSSFSISIVPQIDTYVTTPLLILIQF